MPMKLQSDKNQRYKSKNSQSNNLPINPKEMMKFLLDRNKNNNQMNFPQKGRVINHFTKMMNPQVQMHNQMNYLQEEDKNFKLVNIQKAKNKKKHKKQQFQFLRD